MGSDVFTLRWGILATGNIAKTFTKDLLIDPTTRSVHDIRHSVAAAASSTSTSRAQTFLAEVNAPSSAKAYGSYQELVEDPNVDIIYIATPHSHHFQHALLALHANKHVLVEKPITVTAPQCAVLRRIAAQRRLFLMEALWTRFFPLSRAVCSFIQSGHLGAITRVSADFSFWNDVALEFGSQHRMVNLELAGGALLDLGVYSLAWVYMALYRAGDAEPVVSSAVSKGATGADETTTVLLHFPGSGAHAVASTSIVVGTTPNKAYPSPDAVRIQGTLGDLTVDYAPRPRRYTLTPASSASRGTLAHFEYEVVTQYENIPGNGHGMFWEADECARCVRDGEMESEVCGLEESESLMRVLDCVRGQGGVVYPAWMESAEISGGWGNK